MGGFVPYCAAANRIASQINARIAQHIINSATNAEVDWHAAESGPVLKRHKPQVTKISIFDNCWPEP